MLKIVSFGHFHPKNKVTNEFLENMNIGTTAQWIEEKIGIKERLTTLPIDYIAKTRNEDPREARKVASHTPTTLALEAAKMAMNRAGISVKEIGLIITNCCNPDSATPSQAQLISEKLGADCPAHEVMSACPAFALQIDYLRNFAEEHLPDYILCISTAALTHTVNYNERSDGAIWGDGAAAWIVTPRKEGRLKVVDSVFQADPTRSQAVVVDLFGHFWQDGRAVRDFSVRQTVRLIKQFEDQYKLDWQKDIFVGHQANRTMLRQVTNNRSIPDSNHWHNVEYLGNQAGAGAPAVISMHWDKITPGIKIVVAVVGAGLSWGSVLLEAEQ